MEDRGTELERNEFQFKGSWNGTEQVPVHSWVERNGTSSKKIGTEYNTGAGERGEAVIMSPFDGVGKGVVFKPSSR